MNDKILKRGGKIKQPKSKSNLILTVTLFLIVLMLLNGCKQTLPSPEDTVKSVLDNIIKGNYESAFANFVDDRGSTISDEMKQNMKYSIERNPISAYKLLGVTDLDPNLPQFSSIKNPLLSNAKIVSFTITEKATQKTQESKFIVVWHDKKWIIFVPKVQAPTVQPQSIAIVK